ncbi:MAG: hypothetical protein LBF15_01700 [Candidatus Peribacteria bacterium]|nr:hypothetical protein [Candidatus Peribacteria bacterium]
MFFKTQTIAQANASILSQCTTIKSGLISEIYSDRFLIVFEIIKSEDSQIN